jgi:hypothetical protein
MTRARFALGVGAALVAAFIAHMSALRAPFFADDWLFLDQVRARTLAAVLASPDPIGNFLRPLGRQVWFWTLGTVSGESPLPFHAANLVMFLVALVLLARLARRVSGPLAGIVAASYLALHYAADVPVMWASGSQELLALLFALAALEAHAVRRSLLAGGLLFLALLGKEVVALTPLVAVWLDTGEGTWATRARRAWPLGAAVVVWLAIFVPFMLTRPTVGSGLALSAIGPLAMPVLLVRVAAGLEWPTGGFPAFPPRDPGAAGLFSLLVALAGLVAAASVARAQRPPVARTSAKSGRPAKRPAPERAEPPSAPPTSADGVRAGLAWALAGALPVAAIAPVWSAYYFLFSLAGVGLALGSAVARTRAPLAWALAAVGVLGWTSHQARVLTEFATAPSAWSAQGHVNRFYMLRGMTVVQHAIDDLRSQAPQVAPRTTFFFAGVPAFAAVQVADGPFVRSVYRDSSLRSYFLSAISREHLARGPWKMFFYESKSGRMVDNTNSPGVLLSTALGMILNDRPEAARAALDAAHALGPPDRALDYVTGLVAFERGDSAAAAESFLRAGLNPVRGGSDVLRQVDVALARADTMTAAELLRRGTSVYSYEAKLHAKYSDVLLGRPSTRPDGQLEAYAARVLDPSDGLSWRRWGYVLANQNRHPEALSAFERYARLAPAAAAADERTREAVAILKRMLPGGDIAQRSLRRQLDR